MKMALAQPGAELAFRNVVAWIDMSGILDGTHLIQWLAARRLRTLGLSALVLAAGSISRWFGNCAGAGARPRWMASFACRQGCWRFTWSAFR